MSIYPVLLQLGPTFKCLYILAMLELTSGDRHNVFQDGRHRFYITLYLTPIALWKENKKYDSLYLGKC